MKNLFLILATLISTPAFASEGTSYYCKGIDGSEGKTMYAKLVNADEVKDGYEDMIFLFVVRDGSKTIFSDYVAATSEDVMLNFTSHDGAAVMSAGIFMDELDQTWVKLGRKKMRFDCGQLE